MIALNRYLLGAALAGGLGLAGASAQALTLTVDYSGSSVNETGDCVELGGGGAVGDCADTDLAFSSDFDITLDEGDSETFDFIAWTTTGDGSNLGTYDVTAALAFSGPEAFSVSGTGNAIVSTFGDFIPSASLTWDGLPAEFDLGGSRISVHFQRFEELIREDPMAEFTTTATVTLLEDAEEPAVVPLPAAGFLLLGGLGGLGAMRLRRKGA